MSDCRRELGAKYLAGLLDQPAEVAFIDHLESCDCCREWLEADAGSDAEWQAVREILPYSDVSVLPIVSQEFPPLDFSQVCSVSEVPCLTFLAPSDDPAMIGRIGTYEISGFLGPTMPIFALLAKARAASPSRVKIAVPLP